MKKYEQIFQIFYQLCRKALYHLYYRLSIDATILKHQLKHKCMLTLFAYIYFDGHPYSSYLYGSHDRQFRYERKSTL